MPENDDDTPADELRRAVTLSSVALPLVMVAVAFALSYLPNISFTTAIIAALTVLAAVAVAALVGGYVGVVRARQSLESAGVSPSSVAAVQLDLQARVDQLAAIVSQFAHSSGGRPLQTTGEIAAYELATTAREVLVSSRDLALDISGDQMDGEGDTGFDEIVRGNLARGVNYTYLLRDDEVLRAKAEVLRTRTLSSSRRGKLEFLFISREEFDRLPYTEGNFAIFNPPDGQSRHLRISAEFPAGDKELWMVVSGEPALRWLKRVQPIVERARSAAGSSSQGVLS